MAGRAGLYLLGALLVARGACGRDDSSSGPPKASASASAAVQKVEIVEVAGDGQDAASVVRRELDRAHADRRELIVYVGAPWCEPCTRFHHAAAAGELDQAFPGLRLLEFDHDRDEARLQDAGYTSRLIPLFAVPGPDGRASGKQIEGSIKGDGAVAQIAPRLKALLGQP